MKKLFLFIALLMSMFGYSQTVNTNFLKYLRIVREGGEWKLKVSRTGTSALYGIAKWGELFGPMSAQTDLINMFSTKQDLLGYTPESNANKTTDLTSPNNTKFPTSLAVSNALALKQDALGFTAENSTNKTTNLTTPNNTKYPTSLAVSTAMATKQDILGFTPENVTNKAIDFTSPNDSKYPTTQAVLNKLASYAPLENFYWYNNLTYDTITRKVSDSVAQFKSIRVDANSTKVAVNPTINDSTIRYRVDVNEGNLTLNNIGGILGLSKGGLGSALADPNANRVLVWDDVDNAFVLANLGSNVTYDPSTNTLDATTGGGGTTGLDNSPWITGMQRMGSPTVGMSVGYLSPGEASTTTALSDGQTRLIAVNLMKGATVAGVKLFITTAGNYTADAGQTNGVALFSYVQSTGVITKVAESATNISWTTTGVNTIPFTTAYVATSAVYFVAILYNQTAQTTAPSIAAKVGSSNNLLQQWDYTASAGTSMNASSQTTIASTYTLSAQTASTTNPLVTIYQ